MPPRLYYFNTPDKERHEGVIDLAGVTQVDGALKISSFLLLNLKPLGSDKDRIALQMRAGSQNKVVHLKADADDRDEWLKNFKKFVRMLRWNIVNY